MKKITNWIKKVLGGKKSPVEAVETAKGKETGGGAAGGKAPREGKEGGTRGGKVEGGVRRVSVPGGERREREGRGERRGREGGREGREGREGGRERRGGEGRRGEGRGGENRRGGRGGRDGEERGRRQQERREGEDGGEPRSFEARGGGRRGRGGARFEAGGGNPGMENPAHWTAEDGSGVEIPAEYAFAELGLAEPMVKAVAAMGYQTPTSIQAQSIPAVLDGRDVVGASQTGTGKTAAFSLPILSKLGGHSPAPRCLVLEPTRELAAQVEESMISFSRFTDLRVALLHGGVGYGNQQEVLQRGVDILVATPGRLLDFMERGVVSLDHIDFLVLDEVDRMLDMGFLPDVRRIVEKCRVPRQTLFFSATMPPQIETLASFAVKDPVRIEVGLRFSPAETITHAFYPVASEQREDLLLALLKATDYHSVMIFTRTKAEADRVHELLNRDPEHKATVMHSDIKQSDRTKALQGFRSGEFDIIVATDVAARGLDISDVTHVINFRVPENPEDYVHRIGRTGRASKEGDAFTILSGDEVDFAKSVERLIGSTIERKKLEGFPYIYTALLDDDLPKDAKAFRRALGRTSIGGKKKKPGKR